MFRKESAPLARFRADWSDLIDGLGTGARNMIGIAIATAAAGIVVSKSEKAGFEQGFAVTGIETEAQRPAQEWMMVPAMLVLSAIILLQRRRTQTAARSVEAALSS